MTPGELRTSFERAGQGGVFRFWDSLTGAERDQLLADAAGIDPAEVTRLHAALSSGIPDGGIDFNGIRPAPYIPLPRTGMERRRWAEAQAAGGEALRAGRVAAFTVAGGQGTRLGFDGPKGTFPVTPVRRTSLFQLFAEKLLATGASHGRTPPWHIMTSHANHEATTAFFEQNAFFGLDPARVHIFRQGRMPAVDFEGRIMLATKSSIALSPDGHGGSLRALENSGAIDRMERDGTDLISYFQVDNPLVRCIDPAFIGFHILAGSEMSSKMVPKRHAREKIGHFCTQGGKTIVVEYSDLPEDLQGACDGCGRLLFIAGSIAIHVLNRGFARRIAREARLPFHIARKKIPTVDAHGRPVSPAGPNGIKFEMFVFDAIPLAANALVLETPRADDFSPVKNASGEDSPETARADQLRLFARWLRAAGASIPVDATGLPPFDIEVAPGFALDEQQFVEAWNRLPEKPAIAPGLHLGAAG